MAGLYKTGTVPVSAAPETKKPGLSRFFGEGGRLAARDDEAGDLARGTARDFDVAADEGGLDLLGVRVGDAEARKVWRAPASAC
jgi:hypothetical protein